jgi:hypothetical protein
MDAVYLYETQIHASKVQGIRVEFTQNIVCKISNYLSEFWVPVLATEVLMDTAVQTRTMHRARDWFNVNTYRLLFVIITVIRAKSTRVFHCYRMVLRGYR